MNIAMMKGRRVLCAVLSLSIGLGWPLSGALAQVPGCMIGTDNPVDGCIREIKLDSPQMSVTGRSVSVPPGTEVTFTARAINHDGQSTGCANGWEFKVDGQDINMGDVQNNTITFRTVAGRSSPEVAAVCKDNPSIGHAPVMVKNSVLGSPPVSGLSPRISPDSVVVSNSTTPLPTPVNGSVTLESSAAAEQAAADKAAAAKASSDAAADVALGVLGGLVIVGGVVALVGLMMGPCSSGESQCGSSSQCCPTGKYYVPCTQRCQTCPQADNTCFGPPCPGATSCTK